MSTKFPGINIQWPWSELILRGLKTIETRRYRIPEKHIGSPLVLIETPGPRGKTEAGFSKARAIAIITFSGCYLYPSKRSWENEFSKHRVPEDDLLYGFKPNEDKWAWIISSVKPLKNTHSVPRNRGIVFTKPINLS